jgi:hypothetical protein
MKHQRKRRGAKEALSAPADAGALLAHVRRIRVTPSDMQLTDRVLAKLKTWGRA